MGLDNVAVLWPRTSRFYETVPADAFTDFTEVAANAPAHAGPAAALAGHIARTSTVRASGYTDLVDLLLGLEGVLYATDAAAEDEDPVIDPDGCAWIAGGLERFVAGHERLGEQVSFDSVAEVLRTTLADAKLAQQQLRWLEARLVALRDEYDSPPQWSYSRLELSVLAGFYRRCADQGFAVYADFRNKVRRSHE